MSDLKTQSGDQGANGADDAGNSIAVIGLGYIGLPTAVVLADNGWTVKGVDVSQRTVDAVNRGELPFVEEGFEETLANVVDSGRLHAQTTTPESDIFIVSVPTPFKGDHEADLSYIDQASDGIAPVLKGGELVVLESTVPPGATEHMAARILQARPDLSTDGSQGRPVVHFAHAPERVLPGRIMVELTSNDRIIGGMTPEAAEYCRRVYATFCDGELSLTDARTAEMSKLAENAFRDVNIAFANELSVIAKGLGINVWELIDLANRHPRVSILQPGPGVGGHCIAVDPWFIVAADRDNSNLIRTAREVNDAKPGEVIAEVEQGIRDSNPGAKVALFGLAFKPNIDDLRESPSVAIAKDLAQRNPETEFLAVEPHISELPKSLTNLANLQLVPAPDALGEASVIALLVDHDAFKTLTDPREAEKILVDTRGFWVAGS